MGFTIVTRNGVYRRRPQHEILSAWHVHETVSILGAWHAHVGPCPSGSRCTLFTARVRAAGREFRAGLLAPGRNPQSWDVARESRVGRLACVGCSRPAALLNLMPFFFSLQRFLSPSHPRWATSKLGGWDFFCEHPRQKHWRCCFAFRLCPSFAAGIHHPHVLPRSTCMP